MNLIIHGIGGDVRLGDSYFDDKFASLKADYLLANPPFNDGSNGEEDDTPFEERFPKLVTELEAQFAESDKLQKEIRTQRARVTGALKNGKA